MHTLVLPNIAFTRHS